ncbi:MAG: hypothetical protein OSB07_01980 [Dehalococcoidia bacterium]|nr:hypothetical protein [Dehalococcoidia bacterium]
MPTSAPVQTVATSGPTPIAAPMTGPTPASTPGVPTPEPTATTVPTQAPTVDACRVSYPAPVVSGPSVPDGPADADRVFRSLTVHPSDPDTFC